MRASLGEIRELVTGTGYIIGDKVKVQSGTWGESDSEKFIYEIVGFALVFVGQYEIAVRLSIQAVQSVNKGPFVASGPIYQVSPEDIEGHTDEQVGVDPSYDAFRDPTRNWLIGKEVLRGP